MILSERDIKRSIENKELYIKPFQAKSIQPASLDCYLGNEFLIMQNNLNTISLDTQIKYDKIIKNKIVLPPKSFILGTTIEYIKIPNHMTAFVEGRSSIGRLGIFIQNAGWVDPGFEGKITLELYNASSVSFVLESNRRICQLVFCLLNTPTLNPYSGKYKGQNTVEGSQIQRDWEIKDKKIN